MFKMDDENCPLAKIQLLRTNCGGRAGGGVYKQYHALLTPNKSF